MESYAVVFFLKKDTEKIQHFREAYDSQVAVISPHITLVSPFSGIEENKIIEHIQVVTNEVHPFQIRLHSLQKSADNYLFLVVQEGKDGLVTLRNMLYSGILETVLPQDFHFTPHITLGEATEFASSEAEKLQMDLWETVDAVSLIQGDGITPANIIQTFRFFS